MKLSWHVLMWMFLLIVMLTESSELSDYIFVPFIVFLPWLLFKKSKIFERSGHEAWVSLNPWYWLCFICFFIKEFIIANVALLKLIYSPNDLPHSGWVEVESYSHSGFGQILVANFISLTPGTISWDIKPHKEGASIFIHILNMEDEKELNSLLKKIDYWADKLTIKKIKGKK